MSRTLFLSRSISPFVFDRTGDQTVKDFENLIKTVNTDEQAIVGSRLVKNLVTTDPSDGLYWSSDGTASATDNGDGTYTIDLPAANDNRRTVAYNGVIDNFQFVGSIKVKGVGDNIGKDIRIMLSRQNTGTYSSQFVEVTLTAEWQHVSTGVYTPLADNNICRYNIQRPDASYADSVLVKDIMCEFVHGQANQNPSSFVEDFEYYSYENGNTVDGNGIVTEALGSSLTAIEGVLLEGAETNFLQRSEEFDNVYWTKSNATIADDSVASPSGATDADTVGDDNSTGTGTVSVTAALTVSSGTATTISVFAKEKQLSNLFIETALYDAGSNGVSWFDLSAGTVGTKSANHTTSTIESFGNGWYRCSVTFSSTTDLVGEIKFGPADADNNQIVDLDGTSSIYMWGAQAEESAFPTSYIKTEGATATRNATSASAAIDFPKNGITISCVATVNFDYDDDKGSGLQLFVCSDGTANNYLEVTIDQTNDQIHLNKRVSGGAVVTASTSAGALNYNKGDELTIIGEANANGIHLTVDNLSTVTVTTGDATTNWSTLMDTVTVEASFTSVYSVLVETGGAQVLIGSPIIGGVVRPLIGNVID